MLRTYCSTEKRNWSMNLNIYRLGFFIFGANPVTLLQGWIGRACVGAFSLNPVKLTDFGHRFEIWVL